MQSASFDDNFKPKDKVVLIDSKKRIFLITLEIGGKFHSHGGVVDHDLIIGQKEGLNVSTPMGYKLICFHPTLEDIILKMPRGAQVIYPKDIGKILMAADIRPDITVVESGVGSGALSMALLRLNVKLTGYEIREDFLKIALANVESNLGKRNNYILKHRDIYEGIDEAGLDRIILDLPEPQRAVSHAKNALKCGGILLCYLPTINQVSILTEVLRNFGFDYIETTETFERTWNVTTKSVRPDHRMTAHTGFIVKARNT